VADRLSGNVVGHINEVTLHGAGLVLSWVTVRGYTDLVINQATYTYRTAVASKSVNYNSDPAYLADVQVKVIGLRPLRLIAHQNVHKNTLFACGWLFFVSACSA